MTPKKDTEKKVWVGYASKHYPFIEYPAPRVLSMQLFFSRQKLMQNQRKIRITVEELSHD